VTPSRPRTISGTLRDDAARGRLGAAALLAEWVVAATPLTEPDFDGDAHPPVSLAAVGAPSVCFSVPEVLYDELRVMFASADAVTLGDVRAVGDGSFLLTFCAAGETTHLTVEDLTTL
jgi:hypothetical protein